MKYVYIYINFNMYYTVLCPGNLSDSMSFFGYQATSGVTRAPRPAPNPPRMADPWRSPHGMARWRSSPSSMRKRPRAMAAMANGELMVS